MTPQEWAAAIIARAQRVGDIPRYGSDTWQRLSPDDPRFVAAVAVAAEHHRIQQTPEYIARRLADELAAEKQVADAEDAAAWAEVQDIVARIRRRRDLEPMTARRRREIDHARTPRPGDYMPRRLRVVDTDDTGGAA